MYCKILQWNFSSVGGPHFLGAPGDRLTHILNHSVTVDKPKYRKYKESHGKRMSRDSPV